MRRLIAMGVLASLCGCVTGAQPSYGLDRGVASYDALKAVSETCKTQGGAIRLRPGYDSRELSSYECKIGGTH